MKKIFLIFGLLMACPVYATTMCALSDTVTVVLDPSINGTNSGADNTTGTWWAQFPYGRISGISACIDTKWGKSMGGTVSKLTDSNGNRVTGSEKNGQYCWCKMTHPVSSLWTYDYIYGSAATCAGVCPRDCGSDFKTTQSLRTGIFSSVTQ